MRRARLVLLTLITAWGWIACGTDGSSSAASDAGGLGGNGSGQSGGANATSGSSGASNGSSTGSSSGSSSGASSGTSASGQASGASTGGVKPDGQSPYFPAGSWFLDDVYDAAKASYSDQTIKALRSAGGWGNGDLFQIDFSIDVLTADANTPKRAFTPRTKQNGFPYDEFYSPDCDNVPMPIPAGGNVEGYPDYNCIKGDCHLLVFSPSEHKLYEMWRASISGSTFVGGCLAVWDTSKPATPAGRGLQCTSADAAGFPIAPLLFTADEVKAGEIKHAIRFILPNDRPQVGFVPPATHGTDTDGPQNAPHYGVHLRLRRDYPLDKLPSEGAKVVARALQHYGMYHADGGDIALTAQSDQRTTAKWDGLLEPRDLSALKVEDFEVIDHGAPIELTYDCAR